MQQSIFNPYTEFPHDIEVESTIEVRDTSQHPPTIRRTKETRTLKGFMDTPSTQESLLYHEKNIDLNRFLYLPYSHTIGKTDIIVFEGSRYTLSGGAEDQGGQHLISRYPLKEKTQ